MKRCPIRGTSALAIAAAAGLLSLTGALAQGPAQPRDPSGTDVEKSEPQDPRSTGSTCPGENLSERLERCSGVIRPPSGISPDNTIRPPDPGTMPVIPPPGSPGGNPNVDPKG
jgi:hypothetical protein